MTSLLGKHIIYIPSKLGKQEQKGSGFTLDKEEILRKAKEEELCGVDDGSRHKRSQGYLFGNILFTIVYIIIALFSHITSTAVNTGVTAMFISAITGMVFAEWKHSSKKIYLIISIVGLITSIWAVIITVCDMYGLAI